MKYCIVCLSFLCFFRSVSQVISVEGKVLLTDGHTPSSLLVINKNTGRGKFGNPDGTFTIEINKTDTLVFSVVGYNKAILCFKDSAYQKYYNVTVRLQPIEVALKEFLITPDPELKKIYEEVELLGYHKEDYLPSQLNPVESPVTYLYYVLSRTEKQRRQVAQWENEDKRKKLLKELLRICINNELFFLMDEEIDDFIEYCHITDEMLLNTSQYDFLLYLKKQYFSYRYRR